VVETGELVLGLFVHGELEDGLLNAQVLSLDDIVDEDVEEESGIPRSSVSFRMELSGEEWLGNMSDTFVGVVVEIDEILFPIRREKLCVDSITVILRSDVGLASGNVDDRLIVASVTIGKLVGMAPAASPRTWLPMQTPIMGQG